MLNFWAKRVGLFSAFDLLWIALGGQTSNQYLLAEKPAAHRSVGDPG